MEEIPDKRFLKRGLLHPSVAFLKVFLGQGGEVTKPGGEVRKSQWQCKAYLSTLTLKKKCDNSQILCQKTPGNCQ